MQAKPGATSVATRANEQPLDASLRGYLETNSDIVTRITKPVRIDDIGALSAQSDLPIVFENIVEKPGFRLCDMFVKNRRSQARALGVTPENYLKTLAFRLRQPPRGFKNVKTGPVKETIKTGGDVDWTILPITRHKDKDEAPYVTAMNIIRDPETGFYNSCHAGTYAVGPRRGLISFITPHSHIIMNKYRAMGKDKMPIAFVFGNDRYAAPEIIERNMREGHIGLRTRKGFLDYENMDVDAYRRERLEAFVKLLEHFGIMRPPIL